VEVDYIIGIPISSGRMKERGYNQTELIAKELGRILSVEYLPNALVKIKETEHQINLSKIERKNNVKDSFKFADKYDVKGKRVLLVDDIFTTGATVNECSKVLKKANAKKVIVATVLKKNNL
jgi:ComF family protein